MIKSRKLIKALNDQVSVKDFLDKCLYYPKDQELLIQKEVKHVTQNRIR